MLLNVGERSIRVESRRGQEMQSDQSPYNPHGTHDYTSVLSSAELTCTQSLLIKELYAAIANPST